MLVVLSVALLPVVTLVIASCSREQPLSDWATKADAVCRQAQQAADKNPAPESKLPGEALRLSAKRGRDELDELKKLDQPSERKSAVAEYFITLERRSDALERYGDELDRAPAQGPAPSRTLLEDITGQAYTQAAALDLEVCAGGVDFKLATTTTAPVTVPGATEPTTPVVTGIGGQPEGDDTTEDQPG
jgi:hypothetical protein